MSSRKIRFGVALLATVFIASAARAAKADSSARPTPAPQTNQATQPAIQVTTHATTQTTTQTTTAVATEPTPLVKVDAVLPTVTPVPVKVVYVLENQPVQIVDSHGRLLQVIYLRKTKQ